MLIFPFAYNSKTSKQTLNIRYKFPYRSDYTFTLLNKSSRSGFFCIQKESLRGDTVFVSKKVGVVSREQLRVVFVYKKVAALPLFLFTKTKRSERICSPLQKSRYAPPSLFLLNILYDNYFFYAKLLTAFVFVIIL